MQWTLIKNNRVQNDYEDPPGCLARFSSDTWAGVIYNPDGSIKREGTVQERTVADLDRKLRASPQWDLISDDLVMDEGL
jgi:hypothetical protein